MKRREPFALEVGRGRPRLWGSVFPTDNGIAVILVGGDAPHVGAMAISIPRPSTADRRRVSPSTSVYCVVGHKDDELARAVAAALCRKLNAVVAVVAGVHIDRATPVEIRAVLRNGERAVARILALLRPGLARARRQPSGRPALRGMRQRHQRNDAIAGVSEQRSARII